MDSKDIGNISELAIIMEFRKKGIPVFIPFGDSCPFDLVVYVNDKFYRIEAKTGRPTENGCIEFASCTTTYDRSKGRSRKRINYMDKADFFGVYYPQNEQCYLIPINKDLPKALVCLRLNSPKNGHKKHIRWASDYEFDIQIEKLIGGVV